MAKLCKLTDAINKTPIYVLVNSVRTVEMGRSERTTQINFDQEHYVTVEGELHNVAKQLEE